MTIEVLNRQDLVQYKSLIDDCFDASNPIERYMEYSENAGYTIWVAKDEGKIVGSATQYAIDLFTFSFQPCLMLFNVAVRRECRKQKIAQAILEKIIAEAKAAGYQSISLTCLDDAYPAHKLYERVGFTRDSSFKYSLSLAE